jgi:tetratricopeptide (TPR) repeat protein
MGSVTDDESLDLPAEVLERMDRLGLEFLAEFLGRAARRHPENVEALTELATTLTRLGRIEEGLVVDERLVRLLPRNATAHYNLACSLALLKRPEPALAALERAVELGYDDAKHLLADEDLYELRAAERFQALVQRLQGDRRVDRTGS